MPSQRKRIGFLPSKEVHDIIDKLCQTNEFSQSRVTGLLVEEALRSRGILGKSQESKPPQNLNFKYNPIEEESFSGNNNSTNENDIYKVNEKLFSYNVKLMHEFIEFKYFKKVMVKNNDIFK